MNILILHNGLVTHNFPTVKALISQNNKISIIDYGKKNTNFVIPKYKNLNIYSKVDFSFFKILHIIKEINPKIIVVTGLRNFFCLSIAVIFKKKSKIVLASDNFIRNSIRQKIAFFFGFFNLFYFFFDKIWVHGPLQYQYAKKIGFKKKDIIFDPASADIFFFGNLYKRYLKFKKKKYPKNFLFIGRIEEEKGLSILLNAWSNVSSQIDWKLILIGKGSLKLNYKNLNNIHFLGYKNHHQIKNLIKKSGCFILPSNFEPWGVVVHEMSAAGLPMILSNRVGSRFYFLRENKNGFLFNAQNTKSLEKCILKMTKLTERQFLTMSRISNKLSSKVTPDLGAKNLLSIFKS
jgi:glycosyltransferase involved in cell wall biosynthesis